VFPVAIVYAAVKHPLIHNGYVNPKLDDKKHFCSLIKG